MKILKKKLEITDVQTISLPFDSKILTVQVQNHTPYIWYECNEMNSLVDFIIATYDTGRELPLNNRKYIATYMLTNDMFVYHVYLLQK